MKKSGQTFQDLIKTERLKRAKNLLRGTNMSVENIAAEVGYENVENFNRLFKKTLGKTPLQYRKNP